MNEWSESQRGKKFEKKYWLSLGKYELPLYLSDQVPPNSLRLHAPDPAGTPRWHRIRIPTEDQDLQINLNIRHFYNMIKKEIDQIRKYELKSI